MLQLLPPISTILIFIFMYANIYAQNRRYLLRLSIRNVPQNLDESNNCPLHSNDMQSLKTKNLHKYIRTSVGSISYLWWGLIWRMQAYCRRQIRVEGQKQSRDEGNIKPRLSRARLEQPKQKFCKKRKRNFWFFGQ